MENSSSFHSKKAGSFSNKHLTSFARKKAFTESDLEKLRNLASISHREIENICSCKISLEVFRLIRKYGLSIGAFFVKDFNWEIVSLVTGHTNYMEIIIRLDDIKEIQKELKISDLSILRTLSNACRLSLNLRLKPPISTPNETKIQNSTIKTKQNSKQTTGIIPVF